MFWSPAFAPRPGGTHLVRGPDMRGPSRIGCPRARLPIATAAADEGAVVVAGRCESVGVGGEDLVGLPVQSAVAGEVEQGRHKLERSMATRATLRPEPGCPALSPSRRRQERASRAAR